MPNQVTPLLTAPPAEEPVEIVLLSDPRLLSMLAWKIAGAESMLVKVFSKRANSPLVGT